MDKVSGRSRGFGFVTFDEKQSMEDAIEAMNGMDLDGRNITVDKVRAGITMVIVIMEVVVDLVVESALSMVSQDILLGKVQGKGLEGAGMVAEMIAMVGVVVVG